MNSMFRRIPFLIAGLASFLSVPALSVSSAAQATDGDPIAAQSADGQRMDISGRRFQPGAPATGRQAQVAAFGAFRVLDEKTAILADVTTHSSPADFAAMMLAFPGIATLEMRECAGTYDDKANLRLGRQIRSAGLAISVPAGSSVRSGAVELLFAGVALTISDDAEFAVHAWLDEDGREARDFAAGSAEHRKYLTYYQDMGLSAEDAAAFYRLTNSVGFDDALWLTGAEMRRWVPAHGAPATQRPPVLAYLDFQ